MVFSQIIRSVLPIFFYKVVAIWASIARGNISNQPGNNRKIESNDFRYLFENGQFVYSDRLTGLNAN